MKKKLLVLPLLALTVGMLSGCTKDDIKAIQDHDAEQDARLDALEGEVAGLKNQISALRTELDGKIEAAKTDYQGKIDSANGQISTLQTQLQTLSTNFDSAKADLKADYEAKIKAVDDKLAPLKEELLAKIAEEKDALSTLISNLDGAVAQLRIDMNAADQELQGQINELVDSYDDMVANYFDLVDALDEEFTDISDNFAEVGASLQNLAGAIEDLDTALSELETAIIDWDEDNDVVYGIETIAYNFASYLAQQYANQALTQASNRCDAILAQMAAEKQEIQDDYNAKITALSNALSAAQQNILDAIDDLQNQIDDLNDELNEEIARLEDDYNAQIGDLVDRVGALEDIPVYDVKFDLNYDFYDGSVPDSYTVRVLRGDKLNDSKYALPTNFTNRPGNKLVQWNYEDTDDEWVLFGYPVTESMTLKAEWTSTSENHSYDWFNPNEFQREKLDANGHVRYRCSTHGDACYYDIAEKAGLMYVEEAFSVTGRGTVVNGRLAQGRFYTGQVVDVQHKDGETEKHTIKYLYVSGISKSFAVAGDYVSLAFETGDLSLSNIGNGCMVTKADEMILSDEFFGEIHLFSSDEVSQYTCAKPTLSYRSSPIANGIDSLNLWFGHRDRQIKITEIEYPGADSNLKPGESAACTVTIQAPRNVCYLPVGESFDYGIDFGDGLRTDCLPIRQSGAVVGYFQVVEYNKVLIQSANVNSDTFITVLHADDYLGYGEYSYYLHDNEEWWSYDVDWLDYYYPTFRDLAGWDKSPKPNGSYEWDAGEYATTDVSFTVYAQWDYLSQHMIFDVTGSSGFFDYWHDDDKGEAVLGIFANAGNWSVNVGDVVVLLEGDFYTGYTETTTSTIDFIYDNYEEDFVDSYFGSKEHNRDNDIVIYLRNLTDASMSNVCGIKLKDNSRVQIMPNMGKGGVDPRGVALDTKFMPVGKRLPTFEDYTAPTRKLLGFDTNPNATTPTYVPGAIYDGTDGLLYAIWDQTSTIFSVRPFDSYGYTGRGWRAAFEVKGAAVQAGAYTDSQKYYVRFSGSLTMVAYITVMGSKLNEMRIPNPSESLTSAAIGDVVFVQLRYISGNQQSLWNTNAKHHIEYIWAAIA